jgi:antagonist of KipI
MSINIIKAGVLDTIQDMGRNGYGSIGISTGGAMDTYAARLANYLTGNNGCEPLLEMHFPGPQILFEENALIALAGGDFSATVDNEHIPAWQPLIVRKNTLMQFPHWQKGARVYLAVKGGFQSERWLGSNSTHLKVGAGGFSGRKLQKGDIIPFKASECNAKSFLNEKDNLHVFPWRANITNTYRNPDVIFVVKGREWNWLPEEERSKFLNHEFHIRQSSDRMGYQLNGENLFIPNNTELISSPVNFGTVQLLPEGQMIILMADHQTTGGYPRIANVISAHLPKLAQRREGERIVFRLVDNDIAEKLFIAQEKELQIQKQSSLDHINEYVKCTV